MKRAAISLVIFAWFAGGALLLADHWFRLYTRPPNLVFPQAAVIVQSPPAVPDQAGTCVRTETRVVNVPFNPDKTILWANPRFVKGIMGVEVRDGLLQCAKR